MAKLTPEEIKKRNRRLSLEKYKLDPEDFQTWFLAQGERCLICGSDKPFGQNWSIDHCHATKRLRGILCNRCNPLLGYAKDNPEILEKAARYLRKRKYSLVKEEK